MLFLLPLEYFGKLFFGGRFVLYEISLRLKSGEHFVLRIIYTRMLRHRKSRISTNTEGKNIIFRTFLIHCLLETDMKKAYKELSNEVLDYLNIGSENDIKIILDLIKDGTINFRLIKSISYDQR